MKGNIKMERIYFKVEDKTTGELLAMNYWDCDENCESIDDVKARLDGEIFCCTEVTKAEYRAWAKADKAKRNRK